MKKLGHKVPNLTLSLIPDLLCIQPYFSTPEPDMDDPAYILFFKNSCPINLFYLIRLYFLYYLLFSSKNWYYYIIENDIVMSLLTLLDLLYFWK